VARRVSILGAVYAPIDDTRYMIIVTLARDGRITPLK
jgi:hypothetical protein